MAKFKVGDKVVSVKSGAKGVVDEVYGEEKYAVLFDGAANPDRVEGFQIKAANGCARNAKFKVGDRVTDGKGIYKITGLDDEWGGYEWRFVSGDKELSYSDGGEYRWADEKMRLANSAVRSTNAVVQNALNARTARNAETDVNADLKREIDRLSRRISDELKKLSESYAYWMEADCGRWATGLLEEAKRNKDVEPSLIEEIKKQRRRVDEAIAASKKLPR